MIVEDLHWSDESTRNLLTYAMRVARDVPLLLVGTYRTDDITRRHPLRPFLAEAARLPSTDTVELDRLETAHVAQLLAELLESRPPPGMVHDVYGRCGGNPFLVEEVIAAGVDGRSGRLPRRLQDILLARTSSLSPQAAEVLSIAAVGGPRIDDGCCGTCARWRPRRSTPHCGSCSTATFSNLTPTTAATSSVTPSPPRPCTTKPSRASGCASTPPSPAPSATIPTWPPPVEHSPRSSAPGTGTEPAIAPRRS